MNEDEETMLAQVLLSGFPENVARRKAEYDAEGREIVSKLMLKMFSGLDGLERVTSVLRTEKRC